MTEEREKIVAAASAILGEAHGRTQERRRLESEREWDLHQATAALKAITGLCTTYNREAQDEALDCVGRRDMAALLTLISEQLERVVPSSL